MYSSYGGRPYNPYSDCQTCPTNLAAYGSYGGITPYNPYSDFHTHSVDPYSAYQQENRLHVWDKQLPEDLLPIHCNTSIASSA
jgi:hypothetical protein